MKSHSGEMKFLKIVRGEQGKNEMLQLTTTLTINYINERKVYNWLSVSQ